MVNTNIAPQWQAFNSINWAALEAAVRNYAKNAARNVYVFTGTGITIYSWLTSFFWLVHPSSPLLMWVSRGKVSNTQEFADQTLACLQGVALDALARLDWHDTCIIIYQSWLQIFIENKHFPTVEADFLVKLVYLFLLHIDFFHFYICYI